MKARSDDTKKIDDLDLALEALKDLTPAATTAADVRGGVTGWGKGCYCGTM